MFLENKYTKWYQSIVESAKIRLKPEGYTEKHHIIPKSFGGSNEKENLVHLTAKEHFICHLLLIRMTTGLFRSKMVWAAWFFRGNKKHKVDFTIRSRTYEVLRKQFSEVHKNRVHTPEEKAKRIASRAGYVHSEETKEKIRISNLGQKRDDAAKIKMGEAHKKMSEETKVERSRKMSEKALARPPMTEETKEKCASFHRGRKRSQETKSKIRESNLKRFEKCVVEKRKNGKLWMLKHIDGSIIEVEDLRKFALENNLPERALYRSKESGKQIGEYVVLGNREITYEVEVFKVKG